LRAAIPCGHELFEEPDGLRLAPAASERGHGEGPAQREHVGSAVDRGAGDLLGRGERRGTVGRALDPGEARDPEVGDPDGAEGVEEEVGGLDVPVHEPGTAVDGQRVQVGEAGAHLHAEVEHRGGRERRALQPGGERVAAHEVHRDVPPALVTAELEHRHEVRVVHQRAEVRLPDETLLVLRADPPRMQDLQRDGPAEPAGTVQDRLPDLAHPPASRGPPSWPPIAECSASSACARRGRSLHRHMTMHRPFDPVALDRGFQALANQTRRAVIEQLSRRGASVTELAESHGMAQPTFLQHIRVLEAAGLVSTRKEGRVRRCQLETERLAQLDAWITKYQQVWGSRLDRLAGLLEPEEEPPHEP
jgi:DNA-binding transcriptional ArsR family regulator